MVECGHVPIEIKEAGADDLILLYNEDPVGSLHQLSAFKALMEAGKAFPVAQSHWGMDKEGFRLASDTFNLS